MAKETMLTFLDEQLEQKLTDYEVALDWDSKNHTIELVIRLFAENRSKLVLDDAQGVKSQEDVIEFEDGILLYDPKKSQFEADDYLTVIPFAGKKGLPKGQLMALVFYLQEILDDGQSDLLDFLESDNEEATFELHFDQKRYEEYVQAQKDDQLVSYPSY